MGKKPTKVPIAKIVTRKEYHCPECKGLLTEDYLSEHQFQDIACPHCEAVIRHPSIEKVEVRAENERREVRCPATLKVTYRDIKEFRTEYTKNVSMGGMFIKTVNAPDIGTKVNLTLHIPGLREPIVMTGEVVYKHTFAASEDDAGVGVKFIDIEEKSRKNLVKYLSTLSECR